MSDGKPNKSDLLRLLRDLQRARRSFIEATEALPPAALQTRVEDSRWTARRLIEYCRAQERWHFTRMFNFFAHEVHVYDALAASLDHEAPANEDASLARECAEIWLAGRETEMWVDCIQDEDVNAIRHASASWPQGGWCIREVFTKVTTLYRQKAKVLQRIERNA